MLLIEMTGHKTALQTHVCKAVPVEKNRHPTSQNPKYTEGGLKKHISPLNESLKPSYPTPHFVHLDQLTNSNGGRFYLQHPLLHS